jgi:predicted RecA/RadA family phage recombinase
MPPEAQFWQGAPTSQVDYTAGAAVAGGEVVPLFGAAAAGGVGIAHLPIAAGAVGSLATGGGVYRVAGDGVINNGTLVYWNDATNQATALATGNRQLGYAVSACTGAGALFLVKHELA